MLVMSKSMLVMSKRKTPHDRNVLLREHVTESGKDYVAEYDTLHVARFVARHYTWASAHTLHKRDASCLLDASSSGAVSIASFIVARY